MKNGNKTTNLKAADGVATVPNLPNLSNDIVVKRLCVEASLLLWLKSLLFQTDLLQDKKSGVQGMASTWFPFQKWNSKYVWVGQLPTHCSSHSFGSAFGWSEVYHSDFSLVGSCIFFRQRCFVLRLTCLQTFSTNLVPFWPSSIALIDTLPSLGMKSMLF